MSQAILRDPSKVHSIQDDMESFFWVILFVGLRYLRHNHPANQLTEDVAQIFEEFHPKSGTGAYRGAGPRFRYSSAEGRPRGACHARGRAGFFFRRNLCSFSTCQRQVWPTGRPPCPCQAWPNSAKVTSGCWPTWPLARLAPRHPGSAPGPRWLV